MFRAQTKNAAILLGFLALTACTNDTQGFPWEISGDSVIDMSASRVTATIANGRCGEGNPPFYTQELRNAGSMVAPSDLVDGDYCFRATAYAAGCVILSRAVANVTIPIVEGTGVELRLSSGIPVSCTGTCISEQCVACAAGEFACSGASGPVCCLGLTADEACENESVCTAPGSEPGV